MNRNFRKIINKSKLANQLIDYDNPLVKAILSEYGSDNRKAISPINHSYFEKNDYEFHLYLIYESVPIKNDNSEFKLDFAMKRFYFLEITINDKKEYCKVVLDRFDKKADAENAFTEWSNFIVNNKSSNILKKIVDVKKI